ncbi:hypothetical protein QOZ80_1AG0036680 [Eleusine coracana subsp. coracana]|nr:hypothetical protein QOZ80_1AG0036680 [Eleusine coracana subsp. coracana]
MNRNRRIDVRKVSMDAQRDVKPFSVIAMAGMEGRLHGANTSLVMALPLGCGDARGPPLHLQATCVLNRASSDLSEVGEDRSYHDEGLKHILTPPCSALRTCRNFWSAGDYDVEAGLSTRQPQSVQNRMCVHPKFLHSNATSHKWPFGAVAELLDNAVDEIQTDGATRIKVDKIIDHRNGSPALLVQDDGGGMDPDSIRCCMSFGFSDKQSGSSIGQYGNGFKTSTMRLGADAIVFSRSMKSGEPTQSIGLLSYTFLVETGQKDVVVPMFTDIGPHGTKIIVFNLWSNDDGNLELDFDTNPEDIMIRGAPNPEEINNSVKRVNENHLANRLRYSLRVYTSILYLQLPEYFKIILRGKEVVRHCVAADLIYPECISYRPQVCGRKEVEVLTSIGFLNGAPTISIHGFNIYHKNRLILPFHRVLSTASSKGRGISGVLEADFIKPTHDKQDFEKSQLYQKLINRLKDMTNEYWDIHCHKVGYSKPQRSRRTPISPTPLAMLPAVNTVVPPLEGNVHAPAISLSPLGSHGNDAVATAFASPAVLSTPAAARIDAVAPGAPMGYSPSGMQVMQIDQTGSPSMAPITDLAEARKRQNDEAVLTTPYKRQATRDLTSGSGSMGSNNQACLYMGERGLKEFSMLKLENRMLREDVMQFESGVKELSLQEQNLRREIEKAQEEYKSLLNEFVSLSTARKTH